MKKLRFVVAAFLSIVLVLASANISTFSWFTRPTESQSGEKMVLGGDTGTYSINAYNGKDVTISTMSSATGVETSYTTDVNGNNACSGEGIAALNRKYFRTTITNGSSTAQNVSLYARTLSIPTAGTNGTLALGVNTPTRSYRDYTSLATPSKKTSRDIMRIYFEKDNNVSGWNGTEFYICWNEDTNTNHESLDAIGSNGTYYKLTHVGGNGYPNQYYADIPATATHAFFCVENWGTNNNGQPNYWQRSQTLWDLHGEGQSQTVSKLFKITNTNSNGNATVVKYDNITGNCINRYFSNIFVAAGNDNTFNAALTPGEYIGTLKYYSGDTSVFTVDENNGVITPKNVNGTATLYTKSTGGSYPDEQQVETTVHVTSAENYVFNDVPIVKNIQMAAGEEVNVDWYIINNSNTNALTYTIDTIYLGL